MFTTGYPPDVDRVGAPTVGAQVGDGVGDDVVGEAVGMSVGEAVGDEVVGETVGASVGKAVGDDVVGESVGDVVGEDVVDDPVGDGVGGGVGGHDGNTTDQMHSFPTPLPVHESKSPPSDGAHDRVAPFPMPYELSGSPSEHPFCPPPSKISTLTVVPAAPVKH